MYPPFFETVKDVPAVQAIFGQSPRVYPHGLADQNTPVPYVVFQMVAGSPENYLHCRPDVDSFLTQVDVYASSPSAAASGAQAIRDAVEGVAYITAWRGQFQDPDTDLFRYSMDIDWLTPRT